MGTAWIDQHATSAGKELRSAQAPTHRTPQATRLHAAEVVHCDVLPWRYCVPIGSDVGARRPRASYGDGIVFGGPYDALEETIGRIVVLTAH